MCAPRTSSCTTLGRCSRDVRTYVPGVAVRPGRTQLLLGRQRTRGVGGQFLRLRLLRPKHWEDGRAKVVSFVEVAGRVDAHFRRSGCRSLSCRGAACTERPGRCLGVDTTECLCFGTLAAQRALGAPERHLFGAGAHRAATIRDLSGAPRGRGAERGRVLQLVGAVRHRDDVLRHSGRLDRADRPTHADPRSDGHVDRDRRRLARFRRRHHPDGDGRAGRRVGPPPTTPGTSSFPAFPCSSARSFPATRWKLRSSRTPGAVGRSTSRTSARQATSHPYR